MVFLNCVDKEEKKKSLFSGERKECKNKKIEMLFIQEDKGIFPSKRTTEQAKMSAQQQKHEEVVYEMFIPFLYRGKDKEATERRVFWVFKQLNWGYIWEVRVFGFEDETKKNVTARISFTRMNAKAEELIEQLEAGETAQVHYEQGKPWFWNVVKYTRRAPKAAPEPQVTFKIKVKTSSPQPQPPTPEFKPTVKPTANKFKVLDMDGASSSNASDTEEPK
jgi:hypothetical protein